MTDKPSVDIGKLRTHYVGAPDEVQLWAAADLLEEIAEAWEEWYEVWGEACHTDGLDDDNRFDRLAAAIGRIHDGRD